MIKKTMVAAAFVAVGLLSSGVAYADPPGPDPNGPKCWTSNNEGHSQLTPCGWAYSDSMGWYEVPRGWQVIN